MPCRHVQTINFKQKNNDKRHQYGTFIWDNMLVKLVKINMHVALKFIDCQFSQSSHNIHAMWHSNIHYYNSLFFKRSKLTNKFFLPTRHTYILIKSPKFE
jgi:hypothetical protein